MTENKIRKSKKPASKNQYVNNKDFYEALLKYNNEYDEAIKNGKEPPRVSNYIGKCILDIATNLANKGNFMNYSYKDEMISDGVEKVFRYLRNFNPHKYNNPFAYFTRIIYTAFVNRITAEKKNTYLKYKAMETVMMNNYSDVSTGYVSKINSGQVTSADEFNQVEHVHTFVNEYEQKMREKKIKEASKGLETFLDEDNKQNERV